MPMPPPRTTLQDYAARPGFNARELAWKSGINEATIHELIAGRRCIGRKSALALYQATGGEVTMWDIEAFVLNDRRAGS